jgi:hypothetical protein
MIDFTIIIELKDSVTKLHSVNSITWLQIMHYYCHKWFQFHKFCGSWCRQFSNPGLLCKVSEEFPRRIFKHSIDFIELLFSEHSTFGLLFPSTNNRVCHNLFTSMNSSSMWNYNFLKFILEYSPFSSCRTTFHIAVIHEHSCQYVSHTWHFIRVKDYRTGQVQYSSGGLKQESVNQ